MDQLTFCAATTTDTAEIARLVNAAYRPPPGAEGWTHETNIVSGDRTSSRQVEELLHHSVVLVGLRNGKIVACVQIESKDRDAYIGMLAVEPTMQATGVGKAMLAQAEAYAASILGAEWFVLVVVATRTELIQFYLRRGYQESGQRLPYPVGSGVGTPRCEALNLAVLRKRNTALKPTGSSVAAPEPAP